VGIIQWICLATKRVTFLAVFVYGHDVYIDIPHLFDCKPWLIKFFFQSFHAACNQGRLIFFYLFTLSKAIDDAQSFAFHSLQHHVHICHRKEYDEQKAVVVV